MTGWIEAARYVVNNKQAVTVDIATNKITNKRPSGKSKKPGQVILDLFTANMLVNIYDAINDKNKKMFGELNIIKAVNVGWKLVK